MSRHLQVAAAALPGRALTPAVPRMTTIIVEITIIITANNHDNNTIGGEGGVPRDGRDRRREGKAAPDGHGVSVSPPEREILHKEKSLIRGNPL